MPRRNDSPPRANWPGAILKYIVDHPSRPLKARALARELGIANEDYADFRSLLRDMLANGRLTLGRGRTLETPDRARVVQGIFRALPDGGGHIESTAFPTIYVPRQHRHGTADGDRVEAQVVKSRRSNQPLRATVTRVIESAPVRWLGILEHATGDWLVRPHAPSSPGLIIIDNPLDSASRPGDLVVVEPASKSRFQRRMHGRIVENLGDSRLPRTLIRSVIKRYEYPESFPPEVERDADEFADRNRAFVEDQRVDLRRLLTITIDPPDARDFDDAISITQLPDDGYELGVHIADVAHFVPVNSSVDREARRRGTSVYFPDRVIPMLPTRLSNHACCLKPRECRLTKSVFITYDKTGRARSSRFLNSIIQSDAGLTYDQVTRILANDEKLVTPEVRKLLVHAERLARRIQKRRLKDGMITLSAPESVIKLTADGQIAGINPESRDFSHTIIEMFMVEANEAVSRLLTSNQIRHLRRIHPEPDPDDLGRLSRVCSTLGYQMPEVPQRRHIQRLLNDVREQSAENAVNFLLLRSLAQASYSPEPIGHYALASENYCHFTSPIRRYPDLTVHRLLEQYLEQIENAANDEDFANIGADGLDAAFLGVELSAAERRAQLAERESRLMLVLLWLKSHADRAYAGIVSGFSKTGIFIQLCTLLIDGFMPLEQLGTSDWQYDPSNFQLFNNSRQRTITLGQPLSVLVDQVEPYFRQLWLRPANHSAIGLPAMVRITKGQPSTRASRRIRTRPGDSRASSRRRPPRKRR